MNSKRRLMRRLRRAGLRVLERYQRYLPRRARFRPWNRVQPLIGGKTAFREMLGAIRSARKFVHFEFYILRDDRTGVMFRDAMIERARAGVAVRVLYDSLGSFALGESFLGPLRESGAKILQYAPLLPWRRHSGINRRDHQKILVIDDELAFTGGLNIADEYAPLDEGGGGWYDVHVKLEGPAVHDLAVLFRRTWIKRGGDRFPDPALPAAIMPESGGTAPAVQVISNAVLRNRTLMRSAYMRAILHAEHSISIMNAYFIPDRGLRRAFARASQRGVNVRVILPSTSDVQAVRYASCHLYARLMKSGVRIHEWPGRMMHAKCGVIDQIWTTIGSYNLDRRSFLHNLEVAVVVVDGKVAMDMQVEFEEMLARCNEVLPEEWERRSNWERVKEWCFFQLRYWL